MVLIAGVARDEDTIVRDGSSDDVDVIFSNAALPPLEVEDVVGNIGPVLANVLRVVELLVDAARFVQELCAGRPGGS